jgi:hypothetical protein
MLPLLSPTATLPSGRTAQELQLEEPSSRKKEEGRRCCWELWKKAGCAASSKAAALEALRP